MSYYLALKKNYYNNALVTIRPRIYLLLLLAALCSLINACLEMTANDLPVYSEDRGQMSALSVDVWPDYENAALGVKAFSLGRELGFPVDEVMPGTGATILYKEMWDQLTGSSDWAVMNGLESVTISRGKDIITGSLINSSLKFGSPSASSFSSLSSGSTWNRRYANGMNHGRSPYSGPITGTRAWTKFFKKKIITWPIITIDGSVLVATDDKKLHCISASGRTLWVHTTTQSIIEVVVGPDGSIYLLDEKYLTSLDPAGTRQWEMQVSKQSNSHSVYGMDLVPGPQIALFYSEKTGCTTYICGIHYYLPDGQLLYTVGTQHVSDMPAYHIDNYLVFLSSSYLIAMTMDGILVWGRTHNIYCSPPITQSTRTTYIQCRLYHDGTYEPDIEALDGAGNTLFYQRGFTRISRYMAAGTYGHVYFVATAEENNLAYLYSLNPGGGIRWRVPLEEFQNAVTSIAIDGRETVYVTFYKGVWVIDGDGNSLWSYAWPSSAESRCCLSMDQTLYVARGTQLTAFRDHPDHHHSSPHRSLVFKK